MDPRRKIVICVHGINTHGEWEMDLAPLISEQGWIYYPLHYGNFALWRFLIPGQRRKQIEWFREKYNQIRQKHKNIAPSVIAHSFGTFIVTKALQKYPALKLDKLILCGSIVERKFGWSEIFKRKQVTKVRNEYGMKDRAAWMSPIVAWDTGRSGTMGFLSKENRLVDERYEHYSHGSVFCYDHFDEYWIPFLRDPIPYDGETVSPQEQEEPVSALDAARWSAITYFHQFITPLMEGLARSEYWIEGSDEAVEKKIEVDCLYVVLPDTPSHASRPSIGEFCISVSARQFRVKSIDRVRDLKIVGQGTLFDIPTILNSLIHLDHRRDEELGEAIEVFSRMLGELIRSPRYSYFAGRVAITSERDFKDTALTRNHRDARDIA